ncbi:aldo/keto reductase [Breoghania sp.]|uniref:aldo/keto reductase n=1 Tax=Breoghania sp. TaxID=2065378 RepID=UPI002AAB87D9|nr:aldo/keto reductase [Breoghania sp.]
MKTRNLGSTLQVSAVGFGCMGLSHAYGGYDHGAAIDTLHRAVDLGVTLFDTAEVYGPFENEILVGKALAPFRDKVTIATKFGFRLSADDADWGAIAGMNGRPEHAREVAEASLKRLGIEVIDLYYLHRADPNVPIEDTVGAMADLVAQGKVRALGLSEVSAETLKKAHAVHPISALQSEYSLWTRDVETNGVLETCRELGIGFVPFSPLGRGFLTGTVTSTQGLGEKDFRRTLPRFQAENAEANRQLVGVIEEIAGRKGVTAAQVALAWVLGQGDTIVPIPGARRIAHLEQNVAAADIELTAEERDLLTRTFAPDQIAGGRYPAAMDAMVQK